MNRNRVITFIVFSCCGVLHEVAYGQVEPMPQDSPSALVGSICVDCRFNEHHTQLNVATGKSDLHLASSIKNTAPLAVAGADLVVADVDSDGEQDFVLDGSSSFDPGGSIVAYQWQSFDGMVLSDEAVAVISRPLGTYTMTLVVTDDEGLTDSDSTVVIVSEAQTTTHQRSLKIIESDQSWSGSFDSALMGMSVDSAGDINGDGFDDLIIGASGYDVPGQLFDEGAAFIFLGSETGIRSTQSVDAAAIIYGTQANSSFGWDVAGAGDINGDGYDDVIVGAPLANTAGLSVSGAVYVFLGSAEGILATSAHDADYVIASEQIEGHMGIRVDAAGDVNADGFSDIIVGAELYGRPFSPPIPNQGSGRGGAAFVFLGSANGLVGSTPESAHAALYPWNPAGQDTGLLTSFCWVSGAGDVNGDGYSDVMVGAPGWNHSVEWPGSGTEWWREGAVLIYYGSESGISGGGPDFADARIEGDSLETAFGATVDSAGDVNGDGYDDIIVGAPETTVQSPEFIEEFGRAYIFYGSESGIVQTSATQADTIFSGIGSADWLGRRVAGIGDINSDGYSDIAFSARSFPGAIPEDGEYNGSIRLSGEGITYVFLGGSNGVQSDELHHAFVAIRSDQEAGTAGYDISSVDTNADGLLDLVVGVPGLSMGELREGSVFLWQSEFAELPELTPTELTGPIQLPDLTAPALGVDRPSKEGVITP